MHTPLPDAETGIDSEAAAGTDAVLAPGAEVGVAQRRTAPLPVAVMGAYCTAALYDVLADPGARPRRQRSADIDDGSFRQEHRMVRRRNRLVGRSKRAAVVERGPGRERSLVVVVRRMERGSWRGKTAVVLVVGASVRARTDSMV